MKLELTIFLIWNKIIVIGELLVQTLKQVQHGLI